MEKRPQYIMCPRCELNYIEASEKYCKFCKAEMGIGNTVIIKDDFLEEVDGKLCPICKTNYCEDGEDRCIMCKKERPVKEAVVENDNWDDNTLVEDIEDDPLEISLNQLEEEEIENDVEDVNDDSVDDFEYVNPDEVEDYDDEDEDEDDDDNF